MDSREHGGAPLYLMFSLVVAGAVGYGVYVVLRDRPRQPEVTTAPSPRPIERAYETERAPAPPEPMEEVAVAPPVVDSAERDAVAPISSGEPPETNAPQFGTPGIMGGLAVADVETPVRRYSRRLERCFDKALEINSRIGGNLRLTIMIGARGQVVSVTHPPTDLDETLTTCVTETIHKIRFPKPREGAMVKVVYPIAFWPAHGDDTGDVSPRTPPVAPDPWEQ